MADYRLANIFSGHLRPSSSKILSAGCIESGLDAALIGIGPRETGGFQRAEFACELRYPADLLDNDSGKSQNLQAMKAANASQWAFPSRRRQKYI